MDGERFDRFVRTWLRPASRRHALRAAAGGALGGLAAVAGAEVGRAACRNPGNDCRRDEQCCSGICRRRQCRRAPGKCTVEKNVCRTGGDDASFCDAAGAFTCACYQKVNGAAFCATSFGGDVCFNCDSDEDCRQEFGSNFACVRWSEGACTCDRGIATACLAACPNPA